jgi:hypothetical protein
MFRTVCFLSFIFLVNLSACKKKEDPVTEPPAPETSVSEYMKIAPGNYWVYESYYLDSSYNGGPGGEWGGPAVYDSVFALTDTTIDGRVYHRLSKPRGLGDISREIELLSDSLKYVIQPGNVVVFALEDNSSVFQSRTIYPNVMSDDSVVIGQFKRFGETMKSTPAGTFNSITMALTWRFYPYAAQSRPVALRASYYNYAKGIGLVAENLGFYAGDPHYVERRLIRYHVQ